MRLARILARILVIKLKRGIRWKWFRAITVGYYGGQSSEPRARRSDVVSEEISAVLSEEISEVVAEKL